MLAQPQLELQLIFIETSLKVHQTCKFLLGLSEIYSLEFARKTYNVTVVHRALEINWIRRIITESHVSIVLIVYSIPVEFQFNMSTQAQFGFPQINNSRG